MSRFLKAETPYIIAEYSSGPVTIDVYDLSDNSQVVTGASMTQIGSIGYYKYLLSLTITEFKEYLWIADNGVSEQWGIKTFGGYPDTITDKLPDLIYRDAIWYDDDDGVGGTEINVNGTPQNPSNSPTDTRVLAVAIGVRKIMLRYSYDDYILEDNYEKWSFIGTDFGICWIDANSKYIMDCYLEKLTLYGSCGIGGTGKRTVIVAQDCFFDYLDGLYSLWAMNSMFGSTIEFTGLTPNSYGIVYLYAFDCNSYSYQFAGANEPSIINFDSNVLDVYAQFNNYSGDVKITNMPAGSIYFEGSGELIIDESCTAGTIYVAGNVKVVNNAAGVTIVYKQIIRDDDGFVYLADDSITSGVFDETTAFPLVAQDSGDTEVGRKGSSSETLTTLATVLATLPTASTIATAVWAYVIENSKSVAWYFRNIVSALFGKSSGGGGKDLTFRDNADSKDRITATVDDDGNRTAVILDGDE